VVGVIAAPPANSSIDFKILVPQENRSGYEKSINQWGNYNSPTFVQLNPGTNLSTFSLNLDKLVLKYMGDRLGEWRDESAIPVPEGVKLLQYVFTNLNDIHLTKEIWWHKVSDHQYSMILGGIALLILLIACINYVSLALTTSVSRRTEVGIRKVVGAQKKQLVYQFGFESIMLAMISMVIGIGLVMLFLPSFNGFTGKEITVTVINILPLLAFSLSVSLVVGMIAGSYPALFLSGFRPALVLKGKFTSRLQAGFTKPLVVLQFALSAFLIISSVIMYRQMQFVTTKDLGFDKDQLLVVPTQTGWNEEANKVVVRYRARLLQEPSVISVAGSTSSFARGYSRNGYKINGEQHSTYVYAVDPYYISTIGLELIAGRNFDEGIPSDTSAIVVNEALVKDMKWKDPTNEYLNWKEDSTSQGAKVIGVVKDYHFRSLEEKIEPMFLSMDTRGVGNLVNMLVKVAPGSMPGSIDVLRKAWTDISPNMPFDYSFVDEDVAKQYESYKRWMSIMGLSTGFAILISCLGLFGLAGVNAVNRTKEIGIRKVMGAELMNIFLLLNKQYVWLALIAFLLAAPASWYVMQQWLKDFQFSIVMGWELFVLSMIAGLIIALATVSYHAIKAALANPAETLKYE
jgi:putative ABC transport system permease protein